MLDNLIHYLLKNMRNPLLHRNIVKDPKSKSMEIIILNGMNINKESKNYENNIEIKYEILMI